MASEGEEPESEAKDDTPTTSRKGKCALCHLSESDKTIFCWEEDVPFSSIWAVLFTAAKAIVGGLTVAAWLCVEVNRVAAAGWPDNLYIPQGHLPHEQNITFTDVFGFTFHIASQTDPNGRISFWDLFRATGHASAYALKLTFGGLAILVFGWIVAAAAFALVAAPVTFVSMSMRASRQGNREFRNPRVWLQQFRRSAIVAIAMALIPVVYAVGRVACLTGLNDHLFLSSDLTACSPSMATWVALLWGLKLLLCPLVIVVWGLFIILFVSVPGFSGGCFVFGASHLVLVALCFIAWWLYQAVGLFLKCMSGVWEMWLGPAEDEVVDAYRAGVEEGGEGLMGREEKAVD